MRGDGGGGGGSGLSTIYCYIENNTWARGDMKFISSVQLEIFNTRRLISYLQAPMYYSIYYINLDKLFQKVNIPKDISGHMCLIRYQNTCSDTTFLSGQNPYNTLQFI